MTPGGNGSTGALLDVRELHVRYGKVEALAGVSLRLDRGAIVTVIGPNGAGKSTLLNALMGLIGASGEVRYDGAPAADGVAERVARGLTLVPEKRELFSTMSVQDNLLLGAYSRRRARDADAALAEVYDWFPRLKERRGQLAGTLSGGERQMLAIGRALMARPRVLMLDEPSLGLAPLIVIDIFRIIVRLREAGVAILLVEQNARAALQIADYGYVLEMGRVALEGSAAQLRDDRRVSEMYLGGSARLA
jgi:branched-chain amino acid transport system ATP-binding protein